MDKSWLVNVLKHYDAVKTYNLLSYMASGLTDTDLLEPMEYDPTKSYHKLENICVKTKPISNEELIHFGPVAHPAFEVIQDSWRQQKQLVQEIASIVSSRGEHITIITNHSNVIDIVLVLGCLRLEIADWFNPIQFSHQSSIIVSRGIATTQFSNIPSIEVLRLFTNVLLSFPSTPTRQRVNFEDGLVTAANKLMKLELQSQRNCGGHVLAIAASASRDLIIKDTVFMQPVKNGTMDMIQGLVLPVTVVLDCEKPSCSILPIRLVSTYNDCEEIMKEIATECSQFSGREYKYIHSADEYELIAHQSI